LQPELAVLCGRDPAALEANASRYGSAGWSDDWAAVLRREDIDLVDICTPGVSHAEIALAALAAGNHVLCEKPLANNLEEARSPAEAAEVAASRGVFVSVGFNYRRVPALAAAQRLVREGRLGELREVRCVYLQNWLVDAGFSLTWRLDSATNSARWHPCWLHSSGNARFKPAVPLSAAPPLPRGRRAK
jgi:predicted dehydrogenase